MAQIEDGNVNPLDTLATIAHARPVDVAAARIALTDAVEYFQYSPNQAVDAQTMTATLGSIVVSLNTENPPRNDLAQEFSTHAATYRTLAESLAAVTSKQTQPTQTKGKKQTYGKS